jgi:putative peptidoglycan lipid II flippase
MILKNASLMSLAVLISRILGLVREQVFAYFFGASLWSDAYLVAFRIPNLFRDLFAEGALSSAFVSVFTKEKSQVDAVDLYSKMLSVIFMVVGALSLLIFFTGDYWVNVLAPSFKDDPVKYEVCLWLVKLFSPFILFASFASLVMGVLNSRGVFFVPSLGAASFNVGNIVLGGGLAAFFAAKGDMQNAIFGFGIGTLLGGFLQWSVQWPSLSAKGFKPFSVATLIQNPFKDPRVRRIFLIMGPSVLTVATVQINVMVNTIFATSVSTGAVSHLNYAFRVLHFPMGLFGVALSVASLPVLSKLVLESKKKDFENTLQDSMRWNFYLALGSGMGLWIFAEVLMGILYEHGQFTRQDTLVSAEVLRAYAVGLMAFNSVKVLTSAFYAIENVWVPGLISILSIGLNYVLNSLLVHKFGAQGLAATTSLVSFVNLFLLMIFLRWKCGYQIGTLSFFKKLVFPMLWSCVLYFGFSKYFDFNFWLLNSYQSTSWISKIEFASKSLAVFVLFGVLYLGAIFLQDPKLRKKIIRR